ncbi:hypothetical protein ACSCBZ_22395 [Streptomyces niveiscabiei]|uniref:hypothetical protein n=1 Tax=Streptomyces niveiscabiei TaxID=164115 RepID=UPI0006EB8C2A|nr:hypothetical protein [Streptomyces niveiscabiei]
MVVRRRELVDSGEYGALRATIGHLAVHPDLTNTVPALTVDLCYPDDVQYSTPEACGQGVDVRATTLLRLAGGVHG